MSHSHEPTSAFVPDRQGNVYETAPGVQHTGGSVADRIAEIVVELEAQLTSETASYNDLTRQAQEAGTVRDETSRQFTILKAALDQLRPPMPPAAEPEAAPQKMKGKRKRGF